MSTTHFNIQNTFQYSQHISKFETQFDNCPQHISIFTTRFNIHKDKNIALRFPHECTAFKTKMAENEELDLQHDHEDFYCGYCSQCGTQIEREYIFCPQCGVNTERGYLSHILTLGNHSLSEREIIESYFYSGFEYESILQFLSKFHAIKMSMSTLKRRLKMFGLQRNHQEVNMNEVTEIMRRELSQSGCLFGYRTMWHIYYALSTEYWFLEI